MLSRFSRACLVTLTTFTVACGSETAPSPPATQLRFLIEPSNVAAGVGIAPVVQVDVLDANGNRVSSATLSVTLAIAANANGATLSGTTTVTAVNGVATFSGISLDKAASGYTLSATATGLTTATSAAFAVSPGSATKLAFSTQPTTSPAGVAISPAITVRVLDAFDNLVTTHNQSFSLGLTAATARGQTLTGTTNLVPVGGIGTFSNVNIQGAKTGYAIEAFGPGLATTTSNTFDITFGAAARLWFDGGPGGLQETAEVLGQMQVTVMDAFLNPVTTAATPVTVSVATGPANAVISGTTTVNAASGIATFNNVFIDRPGTYTLSATGGSLNAGTSHTPFNVQLKADTVVTGGTTTGGHTCALSITDRAFCWGANQAGQLGDASNTQRTSPIPVSGGLTFRHLSAGASHTCGVTTAGAAYCWGSNAFGQLGDDTNTARSVPTPVTGSLEFEWISAGDKHTCAVTLGTRIAYCWGLNTSGQLGDGTTTDRLAPTAVSGVAFVRIFADSSHTCAIANVGLPGYCWGDNTAGQLGDGTTTPRLLPTPVSGGLTWLYFSLGIMHTCGMATEDVVMRCWGSNSNGQLGNGSVGTGATSTPTVVGGTTVFALTTGYWFSCYYGTRTGTTGQQVFCWGHNANGQLGVGNTSDVGTPLQVGSGLRYVEAARYHTCAVDAQNRAHCWGSNNDGQLGDGTTTQRLTPTRVMP